VHRTNGMGRIQEKKEKLKYTNQTAGKKGFEIQRCSHITRVAAMDMEHSSRFTANHGLMNSPVDQRAVLESLPSSPLPDERWLLPTSHSLFLPFYILIPPITRALKDRYQGSGERRYQAVQYAICPLHKTVEQCVPKKRQPHTRKICHSVEGRPGCSRR
jgi:hypothetical protein